MKKQVDASGIDTSLAISQSKPSNRKLQSGNPAQTLLPQPSTETITEPPHEEIGAPGVEPELAKEKDLPREENRRRRGKAKSESEQQDYESLFIRTAPSTTRSGKAVYIRKEFHDRIMRIVQNIGFNELSLFSYIDNVLEHHFDTYQEDISALYKRRIPNDIF